MTLPRYPLAHKVLFLLLFLAFAIFQSSPADCGQDGPPERTWTDPATGMEFVWIPGGCFMMGQTDAERRTLLKQVGQGNYDRWYAGEQPRHKVCLDGFWMSRHEVTNAQFRLFAPDHFCHPHKNQSLNENDQPAVYVSWNEATDFARWLSDKGEGTFLLPTEAQWEYAARAGTETMRFWGDDSGRACEYANVARNDASDCDDGFEVTAPVGSLAPNAFGLHDMLGNAWEWCRDTYAPDAYSRHSRRNPLHDADGRRKVERGGSWLSAPAEIRAALRFRDIPGRGVMDLGFRLIRIEN